MKIRSRLDNQETEVETFEGEKYGIMLSGGIDSAMVLYFMLLSSRERGFNLDVQPFTIAKTDGSHLYVKGILDYFEKYFSIKLPDTIIVGNSSVHHTMQGTVAIGDVFRKYPNIQILFSGLNQNPPEPWGDENWIKPKRPAANYTLPKIKFPFLKFYKTHIIDFMFEYNQEKLMDLTHTCTELTDGRCGICFQCNERAWAFNQLQKTDTGKL